jgi:hypothetical protein
MLMANDNSGQATQNPWPLILMVALPFWIYAAVSRNLALQMWQQGGVLTEVAPLGARLAQHLVLLLVALPLYRAHLHLGFAPGRRLQQVLLAMGGALLLSFLARPLLLFFAWLPEGLDKVAWGFRDSILNDFGSFAWRWTVANAEFAVSYVCSLALMAGAQIYRELRAESARRERAESAWRDARLEVLRAQFDPHFLFNTLNMVANLSEQNPREVRNVVVKLSDLLRQSLIDRRQEFVTVSHELEAVAAYMDIQRARFGDRLRFVVNAAPEISSWRLPCFILQPLLENAVRHGLGGDEDSVDIELTIKPAVIAPGSNGLSIALANTVSGSGNGKIQLGLGLSMTRERLATLLGSAATVVAETGADGRFQVLLRFPSHALEGNES